MTKVNGHTDEKHIFVCETQATVSKAHWSGVMCVWISFTPRRNSLISPIIGLCMPAVKVILDCDV